MFQQRGGLKEAELLTLCPRASKVNIPVNKAVAISPFLTEPQKSQNLHSTIPLVIDKSQNYPVSRGGDKDPTSDGRIIKRPVAI